jgi:hypothetical protein
MQTAGNLHTLIEILNDWYKQDCPTGAVSYESYMTMTALVFHLEAGKKCSSYSKKPFMGQSNAEKATASFFRRDPDGSVAVTKLWDLMDFLAENVPISFLQSFRGEQKSGLKQYFPVLSSSVGDAKRPTEPSAQANEWLTAFRQWHQQDAPQSDYWAYTGVLMLVLSSGIKGELENSPSPAHADLIRKLNAECFMDPQTRRFDQIRALNFLCALVDSPSFFGGALSGFRWGGQARPRAVAVLRGQSPQ